MKHRWLTPLALAAALAAAFVFARSERPAAAEEGANAEFISQSACKKCHFKEHKSWKKTVHAQAFDVLKPGERAEAKTEAGLKADTDYTKEASCLACHTTGYGQPGGYPELADSWTDEQTKQASANEGVGCEMCHGAGSLYSAFKKDHEDYKHADVAPLGLNVPLESKHCEGCHKAEGNPTVKDKAAYKFDFEAMKAKAEAIHEQQPLKHDHK